MADPTKEPAFEPEPELYDALVDWRRRLERETPFYRALFAKIDARSVLDVACGTGHHANMFHSWGLRVEGADVSPAMITHCRQRWGERDRLQWVERSFEQPHDPPGAFDAVVCIGNSLAIVPDLDAAEQVLSAMISAIRPGGVLVAQILNLWRLPEGPTDWQKRVRLTDEQGDRILLKGIHRVGPRGFIDVVTLDLSAGGADGQFRTATILGIEAEDLLGVATRAGATDLQVFGNYEQAPYRRDQSQDLILVGRRAG